jgi:hypothetical protein
LYLEELCVLLMTVKCFAGWWLVLLRSDNMLLSKGK